MFNPDRAGISLGKLMMMIDAVPVVEADDKPEKDINIAGRQMPLEMRLIIWYPTTLRKPLSKTLKTCSTNLHPYLNPQATLVPYPLRPLQPAPET